ncbi:MaoC family dehydratase [Gymnodinialimonas hymeniacidonis]|uniref:MaoC family dehydratase n=1 Tax=Gymnodinialimonas hymeniacidonis TaxID=3126508 RepID=UPI0034C66055
MTRFGHMIGKSLGTSRWIKVDQPRIDTFADVTEDRQFIHIDPDAAAQGPYGITVAHGFLTLSLLSTLAYDVVPALGPYESSINYGFDRLRFLAAVPSDARLRAHFTLNSVTEKAPNRVLLTLAVRMEIEGEETPALIADWLVLLHF